jgi:hypothetical protein
MSFSSASRRELSEMRVYERTSCVTFHSVDDGDGLVKYLSTAGEKKSRGPTVACGRHPMDNSRKWNGEGNSSLAEQPGPETDPQVGVLLKRVAPIRVDD